MSKEKENTKKMSGSTKKFIIILSSILAVILVAGLIFGLIPVKSFRRFDNYSTVRVYSSANTNAHYEIHKAAGESKSDETAKFDNALKKTSYSVLTAIFEGSFKNGLKFKTEEVEDENDEDKMITRRISIKTENALREATLTNLSKGYMIELEYDEVQTITVEKEDVKFDRIRIKVTYDKNNIDEFIAYPYVYDTLTAINDTEYNNYQINPITIKAKTLTLYSVLDELAEKYTTKATA